MADFEVKDGVAVIPEGTEKIGGGAFSFMEGLTTVFIPKSVTKIDYQSKLSLSGATSVVVEEGNEKYDSRNNCNAIIETETNKLIAGCVATVIPDTVEVIGMQAFVGCKDLKSIVIPNSVKRILEDAFSGCTGLTNIEIPSSLTSIDKFAFSGCEGLTSIVIPDTVERIDYDAFFGCKGLKSIVIPNTTWIQKKSTRFGYAFPDRMPFKIGMFGNIPLTNITITKGSGEKEYYEVSNESNAIIEKETQTLILGCESTVIPDGVKEIWNEAFDGCTALKSINIPATVTTIGEAAFRGCNGLVELILPETLTNIGRSAFENCTSLSKVVIPESVTEIASGAFNGCSNLANVVLPSSLTLIDSSVFQGTALKEIVIPDEVKELQSSAFQDCKVLTTVTLPKAVKKISESAFEGCTSLKVINVPAKRTDYYKKRLPEALHSLIVELPEEKKAKKK